MKKSIIIGLTISIFVLAGVNTQAPIIQCPKGATDCYQTTDGKIKIESCVKSFHQTDSVTHN